MAIITSEEVFRKLMPAQHKADVKRLAPVIGRVNKATVNGHKEELALDDGRKVTVFRKRIWGGPGPMKTFITFE